MSSTDATPIQYLSKFVCNSPLNHTINIYNLIRCSSPTDVVLNNQSLLEATTFNYIKLNFVMQIRTSLWYLPTENEIWLASLEGQRRN